MQLNQLVLSCVFVSELGCYDYCLCESYKVWVFSMYTSAHCCAKINANMMETGNWCVFTRNKPLSM